MRMNPLARAASVAIMSVLSWTRALHAQELSFDDLNRIVAQHHPGVFVADSALDRVIVVADAKANYQKSVAGRMTPGELETGRASFERMNAPSVDPIWTACVRNDSSSKFAAAPLCLVDGKRVERINLFEELSLRELQTLKSEEAVKKYGPDGANGAAVITTDPDALARYTSLGYQPARFDRMTSRLLRAGLMGARATYITVLYLKDE